MCVNTMIVLFHVVCHIISELSIPAWQKEVRDITREVIQAMEEKKKTNRGLKYKT